MRKCRCEKSPTNRQRAGARRQKTTSSGAFVGVLLWCAAAAAANGRVPYQHELRIARAAAHHVSVRIAEQYKKDGLGWIEKKSDDTPVTSIDLLANKLLISQLKEAFPRDRIISEELDPKILATTKGIGRTWLIDPIDNTEGLTKGYEQKEHPLNVAVMVGFVVDGQPVVGAIEDPFADVAYWAGKGMGAWKEQTSTKLATLIHTQSTKEILGDPSKLRLVRSLSHPSQIGDDFAARLGITNQVFMGSFGLKAAKVAEGAADFYFSKGPHTWDTGAASVIVKEAGGIIEGGRGTPLIYDNGDDHADGVIVSNGVHLPLIKKTLKAQGWPDISDPAQDRSQ